MDTIKLFKQWKNEQIEDSDTEFMDELEYLKEICESNDEIEDIIRKYYSKLSKKEMFTYDVILQSFLYSDDEN